MLDVNGKDSSGGRGRSHQMKRGRKRFSEGKNNMFGRGATSISGKKEFLKQKIDPREETVPNEKRLQKGEISQREGDA